MEEMGWERCEGRNGKEGMGMEEWEGRNRMRKEEWNG